MEEPPLERWLRILQEKKKRPTILRGTSAAAFKLSVQDRSFAVQEVFGVRQQISLDWNKLTGYRIPEESLPKGTHAYFVSNQSQKFRTVPKSVILLQPRNALTTDRFHFSATTFPIHNPDFMLVPSQWIRATMPPPFYRGKELLLASSTPQWTRSEVLTRCTKLFQTDYKSKWERHHIINPLHRRIHNKSIYGIFYLKDLQLDRIIIDLEPPPNNCRTAIPKAAPSKIPLLHFIPIVKNFDFNSPYPQL